MNASIDHDETPHTYHHPDPPSFPPRSERLEPPVKHFDAIGVAASLIGTFVIIQIAVVAFTSVAPVLPPTPDDPVIEAQEKADEVLLLLGYVVKSENADDSGEYVDDDAPPTDAISPRDPLPRHD